MIARHTVAPKDLRMTQIAEDGVVCPAIDRLVLTVLPEDRAATLLAFVTLHGVTVLYARGWLFALLALGFRTSDVAWQRRFTALLTLWRDDPDRVETLYALGGLKALDAVREVAP